MKYLKLIVITLLISLGSFAQKPVKDSIAIPDSVYFISVRDFSDLDKYLRGKLTVDEYLKVVPLINDWKLYMMELYRKEKNLKK